LGVEVGDRHSFMEKEGLLKIAVIEDLVVSIGEEGILTGRKVIGVGFAGGRTLLHSTSQSIALCVVFPSGSLGLLSAAEARSKAARRRAAALVSTVAAAVGAGGGCQASRHSEGRRDTDGAAGDGAQDGAYRARKVQPRRRARAAEDESGWKTGLVIP